MQVCHDVHPSGTHGNKRIAVDRLHRHRRQHWWTCPQPFFMQCGPRKAHSQYLRPARPISVSAVPFGPGIDIWRSCRFIGALMRSLCTFPGGLGRFLLCNWCLSLQASTHWLGKMWPWAYLQASGKRLGGFSQRAFAALSVPYKVCSWTCLADVVQIEDGVKGLLGTVVLVLGGRESD